MHEPYLELAATAVDFALSDEERSALERHLASCGSCRHRSAMFGADAQAIGEQPPFQLSAAGFDRINLRLRSRDRASLGTLRLVAIAALLALIAVGAVQVGAQLIQNLERERTRPVVDTALPVAPSTPSPSPSQSAGPAVAPGGIAAGTVVDVVVTGLRVRTQPTVDNAISAKFDPLLGPGSRLRIVDGPVSADDYQWYLVEVLGSPLRGWVSSGDHDGTPWIADPSVASIGPGALTAEDRALMVTVRADAALSCEHRTADTLPARATSGIRCRLRTDLVDHVSVYGYNNAADAMSTYLERMATSGVPPLKGDCATVTRGDQTWGVVGGTAASAGRIGCLLDPNEAPIIRMTCGAANVGIMGRPDGMPSLWRWVWGGQPGPDPEAPTICQGA